MTNDLKQQFITELMLFSPKYNYFVAQQLAEHYPEAELQSLLVKLQQINDDKYAEMDELSEKDPSKYEEKLTEDKELAERADTFYFQQLEKTLLEEVKDDDQLIQSTESDIASDTKEAIADIEADGALAQGLLDEIAGYMKKLQSQQNEA